MKSLLIAFLLTQNAPLTTIDNAVVAGRIVGLDGNPAAQMRVAAAVVNQTLGKTEELASLTLTDADGRYRLENLPPGRYRIVAGPLSEPTYFPGASNASGATVLTLAAGVRVAEID